MRADRTILMFQPSSLLLSAQREDLPMAGRPRSPSGDPSHEGRLFLKQNLHQPVTVTHLTPASTVVKHIITPEPRSHECGNLTAWLRLSNAKTEGKGCRRKVVGGFCCCISSRPPTFLMETNRRDRVAGLVLARTHNLTMPSLPCPQDGFLSSGWSLIYS